MHYNQRYTDASETNRRITVVGKKNKNRQSRFKEPCLSLSKHCVLRAKSTVTRREFCIVLSRHYHLTHLGRVSNFFTRKNKHQQQKSFAISPLSINVPTPIILTPPSLHSTISLSRSSSGSFRVCLFMFSSPSLHTRSTRLVLLFSVTLLV